MSDRKLITDHFMVRWLERVEGYDLDVIRKAMIRHGLGETTDGELLWFADEYMGLDTQRIRDELMPVISKAVACGAQTARYKGVAIRLNGLAITAYPQRRGKLRVQSHAESKRAAHQWRRMKP